MRGSAAAQDLTGAEYQVARAFAAGECWRPDSASTNISLSSRFLRQLLEERQDAAHGASLVIEGGGRVRVEGGLDWRDLTARQAIILDGVEIIGPIDLSGAEFESLTLRNVRRFELGVRFRTSLDVEETEHIDDMHTDEFVLHVDGEAGLAAGRLKVAGRLVLENLTNFDSLRLDDCKIGGGFKISGTKFKKGLTALNGEFGGDVVFACSNGDDGSRVEVSEGIVDFTGADIDGNLSLAGLSVHGRDKPNRGVALKLRGVTVGGELRFANEDGYFESTNGSVLIHTARIGGDLKCDGAFFGGFNEKYLNSLSIYNCSVGGKIVLSNFACGDRRNRSQFNPKGRTASAAPIKSRHSGDDWQLNCEIFPCTGISTKIVVFQTHAKIFEIGDGRSDHGYWSVFDIGDKRLTLKGFTYERIEESTLKTDDWSRLLKKNDPFTGKHKESCSKNSGRFRGQCDCEKKEPFDTGPWTVAANVLHKEGKEDVARELRFVRESEFHKYECKAFWTGGSQPDTNRRKGGLLPSLVWNLLPSLVWKCLVRSFIGYGFKPYLAVWHGVAGVGVGFLLAVLAIELGALPALADSAYVNGDNVPFAPLSYGLDLFLPILDSPQTEHYRPKFELIEIFEWLISLWGWLTFAFGAISFTPLVKRD